MTTTGNGNGTENGTPTAEETGTDQTTAQEPRQKTKLRYRGLVTLGKNSYADVCFTDRSSTRAQNYGDIDRICQMMDDESALIFRERVAELQAKGWLADLLSPLAKADKEEREREAAERNKRRETMRAELNGQLEQLNMRHGRLDAVALSNHSLAMIVVNTLALLLSEAMLEQTHLNEMSDRGMKIDISVTMDGGRKKVASLTINPDDLACADVSDEQALVKAEFDRIMRELQYLDWGTAKPNSR